MDLRLFYVDDSGARNTGWALYSWIEVDAGRWREGLRRWLDLRKRLYVEHQIPPAYELHATKFANGRGNPSTDADWNRQKRHREPVMRDALAEIAECPEFAIGTVYSRATANRGDAYAAARTTAYRALVEHADESARTRGGFAMIFTDGDGTDPMYLHAHRNLKLDHRRVIEDPLFQPAHRSQWVQMADLVAYMHLARIPGKEHMWDWYANVASCDVNGGPVEASSTPEKS